MSLAQSRERTFRGALPFLLGLHVSLFSMCTVIYLFIHALEDILPLMDLPLRILGALYLVYLTVRLFMKNGFKTVAAMVKAMMEELNITVPVALHLDHGTYEGCKKCIDAGFSSIMFDGSKYPIEENVAKTKEIVAYAHERNVTVEAEIGHVGEGDSYHVEGNTMLTTPEEAKKFVEQTGVDSLAVSIGTAHGEYKGIPHLNFERLQEIATEVSIPLVLHGGSGSGDENLSKAVELGIAKVNICTDLLNAARDNTKDGYAERSYYDSVTLAKDGFKDCLKHYYEVFHTK